MPESDASIWLGPKMREVFRKIMWVSTSAAIALLFWTTLGDMVFGLGVELRSILHPTQNIHVMLLLISGIVALLSSSIYFSDFQGAIEPKPNGFADVFSLICSRISMIGVLAVVGIMFYEVVSRYVFNAPTLWANEAALWAAGFLFLLAGLYAMQQRSHIRIYIIYDMFPRWLQKACDVLSVFLIWVFSISMIWGSWNEAIDKFNRMEVFGTAWDPPLPGTIKISILIIVLLVSIQALSNLIADWNKLPEHHSPMDDIDEAEIENIRKTVEG